MTKFEEEFIALVCPNCGGKVKRSSAVLEECFFKSGNNYVFIGGNTKSSDAVCEHCGTGFVRKQEFNVGTGSGSVSIAGNANTNIIITGNNSSVRKVYMGKGTYIQGDVNLSGNDFVGGRRK